MKLNRLGIILILFLFILTGCGKDNDALNTSEISDTSVPENKPVDHINQHAELIKESKELNAVDLAPEFIIKGESLPTYKYREDPHISYVNITEFLSFMEGGIVKLEISKQDNMSISYTYDVPSEQQDYFDFSSYTYEMLIDAEGDIISYNDFDMVSSLNVSPLTEYNTDLVLTDLELDESDSSIEIDLSLYDMDIVRHENQYYMPLYLANLFFTGSSINVYEMDDELYIIDQVTDYQKLINSFEWVENREAKYISPHTKKYLALYFDYFYGLKTYKNIDTYTTVLDEYDLADKKNYQTLHREVERFLNDQNDLHTSIITAGYMNDDFTANRNESQKLSNYLYTYERNECYNRSSEVDYSTYDDAIVIEINGFSLDTRMLIEPVMEQAKLYEHVIFDISCNSGGNIVGVFEVLSYMTDEELEISYINPATESKITEYYATTSNDALDKNFYVHTTAVSFSAANLFASIVKDEGLGLIVGEDTSGGASAITYTVLPDGAIIVNSSNLTMLNKDDEIIEEGISVDLTRNSPVSWTLFINDLTSKFKRSSDIIVDQTYSLDTIDYDVLIHRDYNNEVSVNLNGYKVYVYDELTNELISEEYYTNDEFTVTVNKLNDRADHTHKIEIIAEFNMGQVVLEEMIYSDVIDDHSDMLDLYVSELRINEANEAYSHNKSDLDVFKISVQDSGVYRVAVKDELHNHLLYDQDGNLVGEGFDFELRSGDYYLLISTRTEGFYNINVSPLVEDHKGPTVINLDKGTKTQTLYFDYVYDKELFEIHVTEPSIVTLHWNADSNYKYRIEKSNGEFFSMYSDGLYVNDPLTVTMEEGVYIIRLTNPPTLGEVSLTTDTSFNFSDYSGDLSLESDDYGELSIGSNTMEFLTVWDRDIYFIDITQEDYYTFKHEGGIVHYINSEGYIEYMYESRTLRLTPGRHYFLFESLDYERYPTIDFELIQLNE